MKKRSGFAVLFVLAMSSGLLTLSLAVWHQTSLLYDLVCERERQLTHTAVAKTFFDASVLMLEKNIIYFMKPEVQATMPLNLTVQTVQSKNECVNKQIYAATLIMNRSNNKHRVLLRLLVAEKDKNIKEIKWLCSLHENGSKKLIEMSHVTF